MDTRPVMEIRIATPDDAASISSVLSVSFAEFESRYTAAAFAATTVSSDEVRNRLKQGPGWVALLNGSIVGTASAVAKAEALYVRGMAVVPAARGLRIGESLLKHVERFA